MITLNDIRHPDVLETRDGSLLQVVTTEDPLTGLESWKAITKFGTDLYPDRFNYDFTHGSLALTDFDIIAIHREGERIELGYPNYASLSIVTRDGTSSPPHMYRNITKDTFDKILDAIREQDGKD